MEEGQDCEKSRNRGRSMKHRSVRSTDLTKWRARNRGRTTVVKSGGSVVLERGAAQFWMYGCEELCNFAFRSLRERGTLNVGIQRSVWVLKIKCPRMLLS